MTTTTTTTTTSIVEQLGEQFARFMEKPQPGSDLFAPDAFVDLMPPQWRFQLQGRDVLAEQVAAILQAEPRIDVLRTVATATGFFTEHLQHEDVDGDHLTARRVWLCEVSDGQITEAVCYCNGEWNNELRDRHAAEAPMIRP